MPSHFTRLTVTKAVIIGNTNVAFAGGDKIKDKESDQGSLRRKTFHEDTYSFLPKTNVTTASTRHIAPSRHT